MPSAPGTGVPQLHPKPCRKWSSSALVGIINGRVRGSQGKGKDTELEIKWCCSVTSPEPPYFAARCSWSPTSAAALGAAGGAGWGGAAGVWPGRMPTGGSCSARERGGARGFPKVLLGANLSQLAPWGSRGPICKGKYGGAASGELLLLCPVPIPAAGAYLGGMRCTHTPETPSRRLVFCLRP